MEQLVSARMDRQAILDQAEPPLLWVILDEGVLTRPVGGPAVMRDQIERLVKAARRPRIVLQVVPAGVGAHAGLAGQFAIASFDGPPDVVYLDNALAGQVVERPGEVARVALLYDILKAEALSPRLGRPGEEGDRTMDLTGAPWRKSTYSSGNGGACVEVAVVPGSKEGSDYVITMRDSKDPDGPVLTFTPDEWKAFTLGVQDGEFDVEDDSPEVSDPDSPGLERAGELPARPATPAEIRTVLRADLGGPDGINIADELAWFREDKR